MAVFTFGIVCANEITLKAIFGILLIVWVLLLRFVFRWENKIISTEKSLGLVHPLTKRVEEIPWEKIIKVHWLDLCGLHGALNIVCDPSVKWKFPFREGRNELQIATQMENLQDLIKEICTRAKNAEIDSGVLTYLQGEKKMTW